MTKKSSVTAMIEQKFMCCTKMYFDFLYNIFVEI